MNDLSPAVMDAIDAAVKAQAAKDPDISPDMIMEGYVADAQEMILSGLTDEQVIEKYTQIAKS